MPAAYDGVPMDGRHIARWRMHNLRLSGPPFESPADVVQWLCAVQSQDYGPAKWSVAERTRSFTDAAMDKAFADGDILRTHVLRPTWHFVAPADIRWMLELTAPRVHALNAYMYRQLELDEKVLAKCTTLLLAALQGGNQLTRKELESIFEKTGIVTKGFRVAYILMNAELNGVVCSGALKGRQHTYALVEERAPQAISLTGDEALAELTLRYFTGHGPATANDLKAWSSLSASDIKRGLEVVGSQLDRESVQGVTYWFAAAAPQPEVASPKIHILQGYDEYIMGYRESRYVLDVSGAARSPSRGKTPFNGIIILDGQVAGHWKRTLKKSSVTIEAALYAPLDKAQTGALQASADNYGQFLGVTATVVPTVL